MKLLNDAFGEAMVPPFDGPIYEWAAKHVDLPNGYVPAGLFKPNKSRWLLPVFDAIKSEKYRVVNILKPTGTGGTLIADVFVPWAIVNRPGHIQWNWNGNDLAKEHAEHRAWPVMENCPPVKALMPEDRFKKRGQSIGFRNGVWLWIQGGTEAKLQAKHIPIQINDECWQWDAGRLRDADARLGAYRRVGLSKQINISQGGDVGTEWHARCQVGERFDWQVPCEKCGHHFFPVLEERVGGKAVYRVKWEKDGSDVRLECPACAHEMRDSATLKAHWNDLGKMVQVNPGVTADSVTFRWPPFVILPWSEIVEEYRRAIVAKKAGVLLPLRQFIQKVVPDFWDESVSDIEPVDIRTEDYQTSVTWQVEHKPALTVDCQKNLSLFYLVARGWASSGESRRLFRGQVNSFDEIASVQRRFNIPSTHVLLDAGYEQTPLVQECARRIDDGKMWGWFLLKGARDEQGIGFTHTDARTGAKTKRIYSPNLWPDLQLGQRNHNVQEWLASLSAHARGLYDKHKLRVPMVTWSNRLVYEILTRLRDGRGAPWLAPMDEAGQDEERIYREQLGAKILKDTVDSRGNPARQWESVRANFPDHYWDCEAMQVVFGSMSGSLIGV